MPCLIGEWTGVKVFISNQSKQKDSEVTLDTIGSLFQIESYVQKITIASYIFCTCACMRACVHASLFVLVYLYILIDLNWTLNLLRYSLSIQWLLVWNPSSFSAKDCGGMNI